MVSDAIGNLLAKDDLIMITKGDQTLLGIVIGIQEPSMLAPGPNQMKRPGQIQISLMPVVELFDTDSPRLPSVVKVVKPPEFFKKSS